MLELCLKFLNLSMTLFVNILVHIHFFDRHLAYKTSNHILVLLRPWEYFRNSIFYVFLITVIYSPRCPLVTSITRTR